MSRQPNIESVAGDPLIGSDLAAFSPSRSRLAHHSVLSALSSESVTERRSEHEPLLGPGRPRKPFYRARPLWLVPFAITAALTRGMTTAPRVEVFTQLACSRLHPHPFNHTLVEIPSVSSDHLISISSSVDPLGPNLSPSYLTQVTHFDYNTNVTDDDPRDLPSPQCLSDPAVQAAAARLQTIMITTMGLLSALTTGWWGHFGERHGRTKVLAIATSGLFFTDLMFILVSTPHSPLSSHGHKLLIIAPIIEGFLGGWSTLQSATSAYVSDCTSSGSRATIFSRFTGVFYVGFSMGPAIGGWIIKNGIGALPGQPKSVTAVFYLAVLCSLANLLLVLFVFPESLSAEKREAAAREHAMTHSVKGKARDLSGQDSGGHDQGASSSSDEEGVSETKRFAIIRNFLSPLSIFLPVTIIEAEGTRRHRDWSLTMLAAALFGYMLSTGIYQLKYLYAVHVYGWGAEQLSYYISFMGGARAAFLLLLLPFFISVLKPKPQTPAKSSNGKATKPKSTKAHLAQEIRFDLFLTRTSFIIDIVSNVLVVLSPAPIYKVHVSSSSSSTPASRHSEALFVMASSLTSMGSGVVPAVQSLALCITQARTIIETGTVPEDQAKGSAGIGKLFGALAVLQATGQMILGPMIFGLIYSGTVATYPKAIFTIAGGMQVFSLMAVMLVKNPVDLFKGKKSMRWVRDSNEEVERGRSRASKDLFGGQTPGPSGSGSHH
ncbi:major facilitator superfamily domain-containing protein [Desarmillaria tabescens]|uniref:Major facilitator superfamily domain-containing protein n=1 Tax=Armillaria tabescens TaxID=1929756 RepID=A0AA39NPY4_ARMTA|nr:major facilitator superfamily domain-containing protein [Desarmillaria tabescens]KAK0469666.1 major facilitator superfamily domain-containing protein [Desarmillaria tabescens]